MKKIYIFLLATLFAFKFSFGQFYDGFTGTGNIGGNCSDATCNGNGWYTHSNSKPGTIDIITGSLEYTGLQASIGNKVYIIGNNTDLPRDVNAAISITGDVAYFSALINVQDNTQLGTTYISGTSQNAFFMHFATTSGNTGVSTFFGRLGIKSVNSGSNFRLGISNTTGGTPTYTEFNQDLNFGTTYLIVVKFDKSKSPTEASLWVNPSSLGSTEPSGYVMNNSGTNTVASFGSICIRNASNTPKSYIDEIRVGATWADVTPTGIVRPDNPTSFAANATSGSQINLSWALNSANDSILVVYNTDNNFSVPTDGTTYAVGSTIGLGDFVIYKGLANNFNHTGLTSQTQYFYKAWSFNASKIYSTGVSANATTWDITPPSFIPGYPAAANIGGTSFDLQVQLNEPGKAYYLILPDGSPAPTVANVLAGQMINVPAANTTYTVTVSSGITPLTAYDIYFVAQDNFTTPNTQTSTTLLELTTLSADLTPPVFISGYPNINNISYNQFRLNVQMDESGKMYYIVMPDGTPMPTSAQVKTQAGSQFINVTAPNTTFFTTITGLNANTAYDVFVVAEDNEATPNLQTTPTQLDVTTTAAPSGELFFSEYIEGLSNNKALEIYNGTGYPVNLNNYYVKTAFNGGAWSQTVRLKGTLANNDVYVIANAAADTNITKVADTLFSGSPTIVAFNGDDAVGLFKDTTLIDIIGIYQNDPGTAWPVAGIPNATADRTLVRKNSITQGTTNWTLSAGTDTINSQWIVLPTNTFSYIGWHKNPPSDTIPPQFIATYPNTSNITLNSFDVNVRLNKQGKAYIYVQNDGMPAPSINTIITNGDSLNITSANTTFTKSFTGLSQGTAYDVYVIARNLNYYYQSNYTKLDVTTLVPDTVPPVFNPTYPKITALVNNTATLAVSMNEPGTAYYLLLNDGAPAPTRAQVLAGTAIPMPLANTVYTANISGLTLNAAYDLYVIAKDAFTTPNVQDTTTLVEFTNLDTIAPQYIAGYPIINNIKATMFDLAVQLNEPGKLYFKVMADGSPAPTINQIMANDSLSVAAANTTYTRTITGLTPLTAYDVYTVAKDASGNVQTTIKLLEATTLNMDITPPSFTATYPKVENIIYNAAILKAAINEPGVIYFKLQADGTPAPTINQVITNDSILAPNANVEVSKLLSGLAPQTAYDLYVIARDNADIPNFQSTLTLVEFSTPAQPVGELFFSEYIEGSSNNKALEIYNPTSAPINLSGYSIKLGTNGNAWSTTLNLTGTLNPGAVYVVAHASAGPEILAVANTTSTVCYFNGNDALGLFKNNVLIDVIGQYLNNPGTAWPVAGIANATAEHTLVRKNYVIAGDTSWSNSAGTNTLNSQWEVYPQNTFIYLGWHNQASSNPVISGVGIQPSAPIALDSVRVVATVTDDTLVATVLCRWGLSSTNLNNNLPMALVSGNNYHTITKIPPHPTGTTVYYQVEAWDNSGNNATSNVMSYTVIDTSTLTTIYNIQYTTNANGSSPLVGQQVKTQGVVTAVRTGTTKAYFIQDGAGEWNGIYVYDNTNTPAVGDKIIIRGTVVEYNGLTELTTITYYQTVSTGNPLPAAEEISISDMGEKYESVLIKFDSVKCINTNAGFNMWTIKDAITNDSLRVDDDLYLFTPTLNKFYNVKGIGYYSFGEFKILPRNASDIVECVIGINEIETINYTIYPNPATQSITINLPTNNTFAITIVDVLGNIVYKSENASSGIINLQHLSKGVYTFMVTDTKTQQTTSKKLIVQ